MAPNVKNIIYDLRHGKHRKDLSIGDQRHEDCGGSIKTENVG